MEEKDPNLAKDKPDFEYGGIYSYADYLRWRIDEQVELIRGKIFRMSPAPNTGHQRISRKLLTPVLGFLVGKKCEAFHAPFDVRLPLKSKADKDIITVVQPDICIVCDPSKIDDKGCLGAPDIIIEILSPGNNKKELLNKFEVYEESKVREYWIVHPHEKTLIRYVLDKNEKYVGTRPLTLGAFVETEILPGLRIVLNDIFDGDE